MDLYKQATKTCISIAVLTGACAVNAQSTVALHGIADASVRYTDGLGIDYGPSGAATSAYRLDNSVKYSGKFSDFTVGPCMLLENKPPAHRPCPPQAWA